MRRLLTLGAVWLAAATIATAVAWQGVGLVGDQVTDDRPATLTASEVDAALAAAGDRGADQADATSTTASTGASVPSSPATTAPEPAPVTRSYRLSGGSAALSFTPDGVTVLWATPNPGYQVRSEPADDNGWRIEFDGDAGRSRVEGWWDAGPRDRVDDDGSGGGSDDSGSGGDE